MRDASKERFMNAARHIDGTGMGLVVGAQGADFTSTAAIGYNDFCVTTIDSPDFVVEVQKRLHSYVMRDAVHDIAFAPNTIS